MRVVVVLAAMFLSVSAFAQDDELTQIAFADGMFKRGMYDLAAEEYRKYLNLFPQGAHRGLAQYRLGESAFFSDDLPTALEAFDAVLQAPPDDDTRLRATLRRGEILLKLEKHTLAAEVLSGLTGDGVPPDIQTEARYQLGCTFYASKDYGQALELFQSIINSTPDSTLIPYARYQLALVHLAMNQPENAATEFAAVAKSDADPDLKMESMFRSAEAYDALGWFEASQAAYALLREQFPESPYAAKADYGHAWALYHSGRYPEALTAADAYLAKYQEGAAAAGMHYLRANCLNQQRQFDAAVAAYSAIQNDFADTEFAQRSRYKIAWIDYLAGRKEEAKTQVSALLKEATVPAVQGDAGFLLGTIFMEEGNFDDAEQEFNLLWERHRETEFAPEALYKRAECLVQLGRTDEAAQAFKLFASTYPHNPLAGEAALRTGDAKFQMAAFEDAITEYRAVLEAAPDPDTEQEIRYRLAVTYHNMRDYESSANTFASILERFPESRYAAEAQVRIGDFRLREGKDPMQAIDAYDRAIALSQDGPFAGRAVKGLGLARYEIKDFDAAVDTFLKLMREYPDEPLNEATYDWAAAYLYGRERWQDAVLVYRALLQAFPEYPKPELARLHIAECLEKAGETDAALAEYAAIAESAARSAEGIEATYRMAKLHDAKGDADKAFALYEEAAQTNMGYTAAQARLRLSELLEAREDYAGAAKSYLFIATVFLNDELSPESLLRAGRCFEKIGNPDKAKSCYEELKRDFPESEQAKEADTRLQELG